MKIAALTIEVESLYEDIILAIIELNSLVMSMLGYNTEFLETSPDIAYINVYCSTVREALQNIEIIRRVMAENVNSPLDSKDVINVLFKIEILDSESYLYLYRDFLKPFKIGAVTVIPNALDDYTAAIASPKVFIAKQYAFGTGTHETTHLALQLLHEYQESYTENFKNLSIADIGCGSGILSLVCFALGARDITSVDIDDAAVSCAIENAKYNDFYIENILFGSADTLSHKKLKYNLVIANIETDILVKIMPYLLAILSNSSRLLLSGILIEKYAQFRECLVQYGLNVETERRMGDWAAMLLSLNYGLTE